MKHRTLIVLLSLVLFALLSTSDTLGQSNSSAAARPQAEQVMQELLKEVRLLRVAMQNMSVNAYRGQILVERLRLQQDEVSGLMKELSGVRTELAEIKVNETIVTDLLDDAENKFESGVMSSAQMKEIRARSAAMKQRQQSLVEREAQLSIAVDQERNNLVDLNKRLDALEREIVMTGSGSDKRK